MIKSNSTSRQIYFLLFTFLFFTVGCVTAQEERQIKDDIARLQSQLVYIQQEMSQTGSSLKTASSQRTASINSRIERMSVDIQKIKGDLDTLRVGVVTGEMPGADAGNTNSIAKTINSILERLDKTEKDQAKILTAIEKADSASKKKKKARQRKKLTSLVQLRQAFAKKKYLHLAEDAEAVIRKNRSKAKQEAQYLYAESLYKLGRLQGAALEFNKYLEMGPTTNLEHAKLRLGDCFRHLGDKKTARIYYEELLARHQGSNEARLAEDRLAKL